MLLQRISDSIVFSFYECNPWHKKQDADLKAGLQFYLEDSSPLIATELSWNLRRDNSRSCAADKCLDRRGPMFLYKELGQTGPSKVL